MELSQKLIFLKWEKDEAKSFFSCLPCKPLPHEEIKFNSFAVAAPGGSRWPLGGSDPAHGGCHTAVQRWPDPHSVLSLGQLTPRSPWGRAGDTLQQCYTTEWGRQQSCHPVASGQG